MEDNQPVPYPVHNNGTALTNAMVPRFEACFTNKADESTFARMQAHSDALLAEKR